MSGNSFAPAHKANMLGGGGFNGNIIFGNGHDLRQAGFHSGNMWIEFRFLQHYRYIHIRDFVPAPRTMRSTSASSSLLSTPFQRGSLSEK